MIASWQESYDKARQCVEKQRHYSAEKVPIVRAIVLTLFMYDSEGWTLKKAEHQRIGAFELWYWRRLLRVPWLQGDQTSLSSVQFSHSVVSDSLRPHELQHARPLCPSPIPGVHSNSCPSSRCHPAISSSVVLFSPCPQSLPASESFPMSQLFASGGQSIGVSALASFLPKTPRVDLL